MAELAAKGGDSFRPIEADQADAARREALAALDTADAMLGAGSFGDGWRRFLGFAALREQLAAEKPKLAEVQRAYRVLLSGEPGLEQPAMVALAGKLRRLLDLAAPAALKDKQQDYFRKEVYGKLEKLFEKPEAIASPRVGFEVERRLDLLAGVGASPELLVAFRAQYGAPNLRMRVSTRLLDRLVQRDLNEPTPIDNCILGTKVTGTGCTNARLALCTVPSLGTARVNFTLTGDVDSRTVGINGPVAIRTASKTRFTAAKLVDFQWDTFRVFPASTSASTKSRTQSITKRGGRFGRRIVLRIARRRVAEQTPQAELISSVFAEGKIDARFDEDLLERVQVARRRLDEAVTRPARRRGATPRSIALETDSAGLTIAAVCADRAQFAASSGPGWAAAPLSGTRDLEVQLHESAANNLLGVFVAGAAFEQAEEGGLVRCDRKLPGRLAEALRPPARGTVTSATAKGGEQKPKPFRPWKLTLRGVRPVSVEFADGKLRVTLHIATLEVWKAAPPQNTAAPAARQLDPAEADNKYAGWDAMLAFRAQRTGGNWVLARDGDIEFLPTAFDPSGGADLGTRKRTERRALADEFDSAIGERLDEIEVGSIPFPQSVGAVHGLTTQDLRFDSGWAYLTQSAY